MPDKETAFQLCGVSFLETVQTKYGEGIVQGILQETDGTLKVIVSHDPKVFPPEVVPHPEIWKLVYYKPEEIIRGDQNGRKRKTKQTR